MSIHAIITVKSTGSPSDHINNQILEDFKKRVRADLGGTVPGVATEIEIEYIDGEPLEGQVEDAPADFSANPVEAEAVKAEAEVENPDAVVRSNEDEAAKTTEKPSAEASAPAKAKAEATAKAKAEDEAENAPPVVDHTPSMPAGAKAEAEYLDEADDHPKHDEFGL